jgi:hypothetical protein
VFWLIDTTIRYLACLHSKFEVTLRLTVGRSISQYVLVSSALVGLAIRYYFLSEFCCLKFAILFLWGVLSDERTVLQFAVQSLNAPSRVEPVTILYCLIWDSPNLEGQVPVFISPRNRVAQLRVYPWVLGSLYVALCDSQSYGGCILTLPKTWRTRSTYTYPSGTGWSSPKSKSKTKVKVTLGPTVSHSVCLGA